MSSRQIVVNTPVTVEWEEVGQGFTGVVQEVKSDGTCDILYDEKIDGKTCVEKNVHPSRIQQATVVASDSTTNETSMEMPKSPIKRGKKIAAADGEPAVSNAPSSATYSTLIEELLKGRVSDNETAESFTLCNADTIALHDALTSQTVAQLVDGSDTAAARVTTISSLLTSRVYTTLGEACPSFVELWNEHWAESGNSNTKTLLEEWKLSTAGADDAPQHMVVALLCATAAVVRLNTAHVRHQQQQQYWASDTAAPENLSEEMLERAMRYAYNLLQSNFLSATAQTAAAAVEQEGKPASSTGRSKGKSKENLAGRAVSETMKGIFPALTSLLTAVRDASTVTRPSSRSSTTALDLALSSLKCDPVSCPILEVLQMQYPAVLGSLHRAASAVVATLLSMHAPMRKTTLLELLSMLNQTYSAKVPYRTYPLQSGGSQAGSGDEGAHTSVVLVTLLASLQATVAISDSLPAVRVAPNADAEANTDADKRAKGGKSKKSKETLAAAEQASKSSAAPSAQLPKQTREEANKGLYPAFVSAAMFSTELLQRCTNKEVSGEYRALSIALVNELLLVLQLPTFPAAAILLEQMVLAVVKQLGSEGAAAPTAGKRDTTLTVFLLDLLGNICAGVRGIILTAAQEEVITESFHLAPAVLDSLSDKIGTLKSGWLASARSHAKALHVGSTKKGKVPSENVALDVSTALAALLEVTSSTVDALLEHPMFESAEGDAADEMEVEGKDSVMYSTALSTLPSPVHILQQLPAHANLLQQFPTLALADLQYYHLCAYLRGQQSADAYAMTLGMWYVNAVAEERVEVATYLQTQMSECAAGRTGAISERFSDILAGRSSGDVENSVRGGYSVEAVLTASRAVLVSRTLNNMFERILSEILALSTEMQPTVRAKAVRVLGPLLQVDNDLIQRDSVRDALTSRLYDRAISVREESVKLLGYYVVRGYAHLAGEYLTGLQERLHDEGISVRKSVVLLFKEILLNQPEHPKYVELCQALLSKAAHPKEEDSIKEIIRLTFQQIWFLPPSAAVVQTSLRLRQNASNSSGMAELSLQPPGGLENATASTSPRTPANRLLCRTPSIPELTASAAVTPQSHHPLPLSRTSSLGKAATPSSHGLPPLSRTSSADFSLSNSAARGRGGSALTSPKIALKEHVRSVALQLVDLAALGDTAELIVSLLREVLHGDADGEDTAEQVKTRREKSFAYCEQVVTALVELLLCTEEQQPQMMQALHKKGRDAKAQATCIIHTIALFCQAHPPFIGRHLNTLLPYLKQDDSYSVAQNALITLKVTEILTHGAQMDNAHFSFDMSAVVKDLRNCALRQSGRNIKAAVNCLAVLAENVTKDVEPLFKLAETCFGGIKNIASTVRDPTNLTPGHLGNLRRLLVVFGSICECARKCPKVMTQYASQYNTANLSAAAQRLLASLKADNVVALKDISEVEVLHPAILCGACYSAAVYALTVPNAQVQISGAQALCGVFSGCPRLMLLAQEEGLLGALLGDLYDDAVHERFLVALKEMMAVEEERMATAQALKQMKSSGVAVVEGDAVMSNKTVDVESTIAGSTLQQHYALLQGFLCHRSAALRFASVELIHALLRQGMLTPLDVIAPLIALQGDQDHRIRNTALSMLQIIDERYPTFLGNRMLDGIELSHAYQIAAVGHSTARLPLDGHSSEAPCVFSGFYGTCVTHPKRRRELLDGVLSRAHGLLAKLREQISQCPGSYEAVLLQQQQQQQQLQQQAAASAEQEVNGTSTGNGTSGRALSRTPSLTRVASSSSKSTPAVNAETLKRVVEEGLSKPALSVFLASTLAYLPYDTAEEPLQVVYQINRNVTVGTSLLLSRLRAQLLGMGCEVQRAGAMLPPAVGTKPKGSRVTAKPATANSGSGPILESEQELTVSDSAASQWLQGHRSCVEGSRAAVTVAQVRMVEVLMLALQLRCCEPLLRLKAFLKAAYALSDERCSSYSPADLTPNTTGDKLSLAADLEFTALPTGAVELSTAVPATGLLNIVEAQDGQELAALLRTIAGDYNRVLHLLNDDAADFTLSVRPAASGKRKRRVTAAVDGGAAEVANGSAPASPAKKGSKAAGAKKGSATNKTSAGKSSRKKARRISATASSGSGSDSDDGYQDDSGDENWEG